MLTQKYSSVEDLLMISQSWKATEIKEIEMMMKTFSEIIHVVNIWSLLASQCQVRLYLFLKWICHLFLHERPSVSLGISLWFYSFFLRTYSPFYCSCCLLSRIKSLTSKLFGNDFCQLSWLLPNFKQYLFLTLRRQFLFNLTNHLPPYFIGINCHLVKKLKLTSIFGLSSNRFRYQITGLRVFLVVNFIYISFQQGCLLHNNRLTRVLSWLQISLQQRFVPAATSLLRK